jgi:photosystem II stability/assembly factor-like uncharacterized protein
LPIRQQLPHHVQEGEAVTTIRPLQFVLLMGLIISTLASSPAVRPVAARQSDVLQSEVRLEERWEIQPSGVSDDLHDVTFVSPTVGWAVGDHNTILKTTDGGGSWQRQVERREAGPEFREVTMVNPDQGWVRARNELLYTSNGGQAWRPVSLTGITNSLGAGAVVGQSRFQLYVPAGTTAPALARTDDGGNTWTTVARSLPFGNNVGFLHFTDPQRGWMIGATQLIPPVYGLAMTEDGGSTWRTVDQTANRSQKLQFVNPSTGWVLGEDGTTILATTTGGARWDRQVTPLLRVQELTDLHFVNEPVGHVLSSSSGNPCGQGECLQVIRTVDGGNTWGLLGQVGTPGRVNALSFPDTRHGWVVGARGFIIHYYVVEVPSDAGGE